MRSVPFKQVLHAVAYKMSLDPDQSNFLSNQAIAVGTYIDQWVTRVWDARDWPELVQTRQFVPDANHLVRWDAAAFGGASDTLIKIGRVLKVYLIDPATTDAPVDTHFTMNDLGIHCGYEHGSHVWIRYMPVAPHYTAVLWRPDVKFQKDDITYSERTGQVYRSKANGNKGHDPSLTFAPPPPNDQPPQQLDTEITQELDAFQSGLSVQNKIMEIRLATSGGAVDIPNPPPDTSEFFINVNDDTNTHIAGVAWNNDGLLTLLDATNGITASLITQLPSFTITSDTATFTIRLEAGSDFSLPNELYIGPTVTGQKSHKLVVTQIQAFVAATTTVDEQRQIISFTLTDDQAIQDGVYEMTFKDIAGLDHTVSYTALQGDGPNEIHSGLMALVAAAASTDDFFSDVFSTLDTTSNTANYSTSTHVSLNVQVILPGSPWWELVLFAEVLANQAERGGYADILKEWGQTDKGTAEEGQVPSEIQNSAGTFQTTPDPELTGQQRALSRYKIG